MNAHLLISLLEVDSRAIPHAGAEAPTILWHGEFYCSGVHGDSAPAAALGTILRVLII